MPFENLNTSNLINLKNEIDLEYQIYLAHFLTIMLFISIVDAKLIFSSLVSHEKTFWGTFASNIFCNE